MKKYRFYYHYNKPLSSRVGKVMWSVHWKGKCYPCEHIICQPSTISKAKKTQPYAVMEGFSHSVVPGKGTNTVLIL